MLEHFKHNRVCTTAVIVAAFGCSEGAAENRLRLMGLIGHVGAFKVRWRTPKPYALELLDE